MITTTVTCNCGCGAVRGATNHWWLVDSSGPYFAVSPWRDDLSDTPYYRHAAGAECVQKLLSKWMEEQRSGASRT